MNSYLLILSLLLSSQALAGDKTYVQHDPFTGVVTATVTMSDSIPAPVAPFLSQVVLDGRQDVIGKSVNVLTRELQDRPTKTETVEVNGKTESREIYLDDSAYKSVDTKPIP